VRGVKILTGNDLASGDVIWWAGGEEWSRFVAEAVDAGDHGEAIAAREMAAQRVNGAYIVAAELGPEGPRPLHIKERIRALGPTVRPDLGIRRVAPAPNWVI